jgi:cytochrome c oxidase subunit 4
MPEHIVSLKVYIAVFSALIVLTGVTILAATFDLGPLNAVVALTIAVSKALLVVLFFMHVRYSSRLTQVVVAIGLLWLLILIMLVMTDYLTRPRAAQFQSQVSQICKLFSSQA